MSTPYPTVSPLRQRMIEDMRVRKFGEKPQSHYLRAVLQFAKYLGRSPDTSSIEELRNYQLHLSASGCRSDEGRERLRGKSARVQIACTGRLGLVLAWLSLGRKAQGDTELTGGAVPGARKLIPD